MNNTFSFRKHEHTIVIEGKTYKMDCSEKAGNALNTAAKEARVLAGDIVSGIAGEDDVKAMYERAFDAVLGKEATDEILRDHDMDIYDYDDLARFLAAQYNYYHAEERIKPAE